MKTIDADFSCSIDDLKPFTEEEIFCMFDFVGHPYFEEFRRYVKRLGYNSFLAQEYLTDTKPILNEFRDALRRFASIRIRIGLVEREIGEPFTEDRLSTLTNFQTIWDNFLLISNPDVLKIFLSNVEDKLKLREMLLKVLDTVLSFKEHVYGNLCGWFCINNSYLLAKDRNQMITFLRAELEVIDLCFPGRTPKVFVSDLSTVVKIFKAMYEANIIPWKTWKNLPDLIESYENETWSTPEDIRKRQDNKHADSKSRDKRFPEFVKRCAKRLNGNKNIEDVRELLMTLLNESA